MIIKYFNTWKSEASDKKCEHHHVGEDCGEVRNLVTIKGLDEKDEENEEEEEDDSGYQ